QTEQQTPQTSPPRSQERPSRTHGRISQGCSNRRGPESKNPQPGPGKKGRGKPPEVTKELPPERVNHLITNARGDVKLGVREQALEESDQDNSEGDESQSGDLSVLQHAS